MAVKAILETRPQRVLDLCTGTGDLAIRLRKNADRAIGIWGLDYSEPMLEYASIKSLRANISVEDSTGEEDSVLRDFAGIRFVHGDAAALPFSDGFFDAIGIAFAFRNLTFKHPDSALFLAETMRVLRPGGLFVIVETSQPANSFIRRLVHFYLRAVAVPLGGWISGHRGAYHYLAHSAIHYYSAGEVKALLAGAGFSRVRYRLLLGGVAALWEAIK